MAPTARKHGAKPGDLIEISRGAYQHWAVYIGNDEVVHLTIDGLVKCDNIWKVVLNDKFKVNNLLDNEYHPHTPDVIVKEAKERVGKKVRYSLTDYNCEHFAAELRYGKPESRQVRITIFKVLRYVGTCGVIGTLGAFGGVGAAAVAGAIGTASTAGAFGVAASAGVAVASAASALFKRRKR
ncbi:phospholipase A and acyltransferase 3-like [Notolabrus celidotus]|uniref:phospholipase A and acyltransferase 3-like n=1 Tax=Notolabrus celidotus TaxID=1203425 RepID=UPI00148FC521|nr:phospholipase A and acyltransferase 3-like [Notolabrus celidotus]